MSKIEHDPTFSQPGDGMERETHADADVNAALNAWVDGPGNSAKRLMGEDPMPPKGMRATRDSWQALDMPELHEEFELGLAITAKEKELLELGHIPDAMEDHWFMYYEDDVVHYHRSWTGICIFEARVEPSDEGYVVSRVRVNRDPEEHGNNDIDYDKQVLSELILWEIGRVKA